MRKYECDDQCQAPDAFFIGIPSVYIPPDKQLIIKAGAHRVKFKKNVYNIAGLPDLKNGNPAI